MNDRERFMQTGFWLLALLWLPAAIAATTVVRFTDGALAGADPGPALLSLAPVTVCGLPLALACRCLRRLGYRRYAWAAGVLLGAATVAVALPAGLLGPIAVAVSSLLLSLPAWIAAFLLGRRGRRHRNPLLAPRPLP